MDFFEAQNTFKQMFPDKLVKFSFDHDCIWQIDCMMTEGKPNLIHHVEYRRVKITVDGVMDQYIPISPHRENINFDTLKKLIQSKDEVYLHPDTLKILLESKNDPERQEEYKSILSNLMNYSGMTIDQIESKI